MSALLAPPLPAPRPRRPFLVADLLCGAGGSSTGARRAIEAAGLSMELVAVNHWPRAIETHRLNHPQARHYVEDIAAVRPHLLVPEGRLDLLLASPTCTHHSRARGGKPTSDQQRADPWHIVTWLTELRVKRLLIENVPEFVEWGPVDPRNFRPLRSRKGEYFKAWIAALNALGMRTEWRIVNAADYGDGTTRRRFMLLGRADGRAIHWPRPSHSRTGGADLFGNGTQRWRPARASIDWSLRGSSIYGRKRPLAPATLRRIYAGIVRFGWPEPYVVVLRNHMAARSIELPLPAITAGGGHLGLATPILLNRHGGDGGVRAHSLDAPVPTATASGAGYLIEPFLLPQANGQNPTREVTAPVPTVTTVARIGLVEPFVCGNRTHNTPKSVDDPIGGITTTTGGGQFLISTRQGEGGGPAPRSVEDRIPTVVATDSRFGVVEPFLLSQASGGAPRGTDAPVPTIPGGGAHALVAPYYGSGSGATCKPIDQPLDTVTAKSRFGLVVPITHHDGSNRCRGVDEPLPTITTAARGELAFIAAAVGERAEPAPRYDILFRMLEPHELAAAMGFDDYRFAGNKTEITKQIGNAVPVNTAAALVAALLRE